ncbi:hypothetical protein [Amycolatopsis sp. 195334CR]|uniref:hypothetical protein n=1 Tax=Amycolatopsis sp. 195334CR TaxID=2814588 RepID=UPI001A8D975E|nr:hypothetical protein [Amycolatopsis sp. 195334CR]MBN6036173.1 hypothetical protein [Amycolatopsis sp. 195334CR]
MKAGGSVVLVGLLAGAAVAIAVVPGATVPRAVAPPAEAAAASGVSAGPGPAAPASVVPDPPAVSPAPPPEDPAPSAADVTAAAPDAKLGVVVYDRESAKTLADHRSTAKFTSASLVKLLIALDALESGAASPSTVERMIARSDDEIASRLWSESGGGALVTRWAKRMQLADTRPPEDPGRWGDTTTTAADVARIYRYLLSRAPDASRAPILRGLRATTPHGSDGFAQHFGIPDAAGTTPWAVKQGWACCRPKRQLHTTGLVGENDRYIVVVLSDHPESVGYATASKRVTEVVRALLPLLE